MKFLLLASVASIMPVAFDTCETVTIKGEDGKPLRVNKTDYDLDQAEGGPNKMTLHKDEQAQPDGALQAPTSWPEGVQPTAAPSAPDFSQPAGAAPLIDPNKNAAAPTAPSADSKLVAKIGTGSKARYQVVNGRGEPYPGPGFDEKGYPTEADAWSAIMESNRAAPVAPVATPTI